jgi:glucose/mannose transport system substrate-binding protein
MRSKRAFLLNNLVAFACCLTFCSPTLSQAGDKGQVEIFSWWTSGGEASALEALFKVFRDQNSGVEVVNAAIAGGTGSAALPVLQTRLVGGDPPDTWQSHPGWELFARYIDPGYCQPITDLYKSENWRSVVPNSLLDQITRNGDIYAVLAGIHRGNVLWYNKKLLDKHGIKIGDKISFEEFFAAADKLKAAGVTPLAVGDSGIWASGDILENTILAKIGPQGWMDLFSGKLAWNDSRVRESIQIYGKLLDYQNRDHSALSWDQAIKAVIDARCAFSVMGDWSYGEFLKAKQIEKEDFGWVTFPGTENSFMVVADGFILAKNAPHTKETIAWLKAIGSKEGQLAFNKLKGSIPARTDMDRNEFGMYHQWSMRDFANSALVPSVFHGAAAPPAYLQSLSDAVSGFVVNRNVDSFIRTAAAAAKDNPTN